MASSSGQARSSLDVGVLSQTLETGGAQMRDIGLRLA